MGLKHTF